MAKRLTIPGSIFVTKGSKNLYIKYKGKRVSTGLEDTPENRRVAQEMVRTMHLEGLGIVEKKQAVFSVVSSEYEQFKARYGVQKSEGTHEVYDIAYNRLFRGAEDTPFSVERLERAVLTYLGTATSHSPYTVLNTLRTMSTFFAWAVREKKLPVNPIKREYFPKTPEPVVDIFTDEECRLLLDYFAESDPEYARLISFLLLTGFRIHEALELKWSDIRENKIFVESKDHRKMESVPMSSQLRSLFAEQKSSTQDRPSKKDLKVYVFRWQAQSSSRLRERLYLAMDDLGIERRDRSMHEFRKTFISKMANMGIDIRLASKLARCTIEVMTAHYTQLNTSVVQGAAQRIGDSMPSLMPETGSRELLDLNLTN